MAAITPARVGVLLLYMSCINLSLKSIYATELSHPTPKTWWLHRDGPEVYSAGRLTSRMIKYASEAGFKSIISLFTFEDEPVLGDGQVLVTTADEKFVTEGLGLEVSLVMYALLSLRYSKNIISFKVGHIYTSRHNKFNRCWFNVGQRRRRWINVKPTLI